MFLGRETLKNHSQLPKKANKFSVGAVASFSYVLPTLYLGDIVISGNVTLTVESDLNGASPRFTLTCISTGGPATTVTWTRNSVVVTEGTKSVLDDPVTAQYTHTLTGSTAAEYTCNVSNNKPSTASASYTVKGTYIAMAFPCISNTSASISQVLIAPLV